MPDDGVVVHEAGRADLAEVTAILDAAMLQIDREHLENALTEGAVLVATGPGAHENTVLGTLVLEETEITSIAVRPNRRGQGIGRALVDAAAQRRVSLVALFDPRVEAFWSSLGFEIESVPDSERLRGSLEGRPDGALPDIE